MPLSAKLANFVTNDSNDNFDFDDDDDLIMISSYGGIIRIRVSDVSKMSRYGSGVRVMKLKDNDQVVTMARAEHDSSEEISEVEKPDEAEITEEEEE